MLKSENKPVTKLKSILKYSEIREQTSIGRFCVAEKILDPCIRIRLCFCFQHYTMVPTLGLGHCKDGILLEPTDIVQGLCGNCLIMESFSPNVISLDQVNIQTHLKHLQ